jgi:AcrR family transcriptional regulator
MGSGKPSTRERIMVAALDLFGEQSYGMTTLQDIADRLGLTKAALYYYFKTKDELLNDISLPFMDELERIVAEAEARSGGPEAQRALIHSLTEHLLGRRAMVMVLCFDRSLEEHPVKQRVHDLLDRTTVLLSGPKADQEQTVRALAAYGAILLPVLGLPDPIVESGDFAVKAITAAASDVLSISDVEQG